MPTTAVQIANVALARCGINRTITDFDEDSQEASACSLFYEDVIDQVLRDVAWPFATRYQTLALVEEEPNDDWAYAYRVPSDMIRAIRIATGVRRENPRTVFKIGSDEAGLLIYCDTEDAVLEYTARITNPAMYSPDFASAASWRLAMDIATPLSTATGFGDRAAKYYVVAIAQATSTAANEQAPDAPPEAEHITARG